jgi:hypothetical protein
MQYRLKTTVGNETSSVFISRSDAKYIAGDMFDKVVMLVGLEGGERGKAEMEITPTMTLIILQ